MIKQQLELTLLLAGITARVRKSRDKGWYVYPGVDNSQRYAVSTEEELRGVMQKIINERRNNELDRIEKIKQERGEK